MSSEHVRSQAIAQIRQVAFQILEQTPDASVLGREKELSPEINFAPVVPIIEKMVNAVRQVREADLSFVSYSYLQEAAGRLLELKALLQQVKSFKLAESPHPAEKARELRGQIEDFFNPFAENIGGVLSRSFACGQASDLAQNADNARRIIADIDRHIAESRSKAQSELSSIEAMAKELRELSSTASAGKFSSVFDAAAKSHGGKANGWLVATFVSMLLTIASAVFLVDRQLATVLSLGGGEADSPVVQRVPDSESPSATPLSPSGIEIAAMFTTKVFILSMLSFLVVWCSKNYRAQKHNQMLNQHRANALRASQLFLEATKDMAARETIVSLVAQAAFGSRPTGYDHADSSDNAPIIVNPVLDVARFARESGKLG